MPTPRALTAACQEARAHFDDGRLTVSTGAVTCAWRLTDAGLLTCLIRDDRAGYEWPIAETADGVACDWRVPGIDAAGHGGVELLDIRMHASDDDGFSAQHLAVEVALYYPGPVMTVRLCIWAYPRLAGLRTQLWLKPGVAARTRQLETTGRCAWLPVAPADAAWHAAGYFNHTQARNQPGLDLLKTYTEPGPHPSAQTIDWASLAWLDAGGQMLALVKESHKCVNQAGCDTGTFTFDAAAGLASDGWGMASAHLDPNRYHPAWAHWCVLASGGPTDLQRALKQFDRTRFGFDPQRDVYIISNTWGSRGSVPKGRGSRDAATEDNILREIDAAADLGIDTVQIDDGWQVPAGNLGWRPTHDHGWRPHPTMFPRGWPPVRDHAAQQGVKLGLWCAAQWVSLPEMLENRAAGGFVQWKLDFADLPRHEDVRELTDKMRRFVQATGHAVRMNLDVTENQPRFGYYFGREFGCCYLENRKPWAPEKVVYVPHLVLRDLWQLAHYCNLHRFQGTVQNVASVNPDIGDARLHSQAYATAIALASTPVFFMELQTLSAAQRDEIRPLLAAYRRVRAAMYESIVYPIGAEPDNASWTDFQCERSATDGYLLIFRERLNGQATAALRLHGLAGRRLTLTDLLTGQSTDRPAVGAGAVAFDIPTAPGFAFLQYAVA